MLACWQSAPTFAQSKSRFYCGSTDQQKPATILVTKGEQEEKTFIVWKSKERCRSVSMLFQRASEGNLKYFFGGTKGGKSVVCGADSRRKSCQLVLFDVANNSQAQSFANQLESIGNGQGNSPIEL